MEDIKENNISKNNLQITNNIITENENIFTDSTISKNHLINPLINKNNDSIKSDKENIKNIKKKKVNFIDQIEVEKDIAQIIFINDKASLDEDKINSSKYIEQYRKQRTALSVSEQKKTNNTEIYRIKRPKKVKFLFYKRKIETINEQCTCFIF